MYGELKVFSGRAHPDLAVEICEYLNTFSSPYIALSSWGFYPRRSG